MKIFISFLTIWLMLFPTSTNTNAQGTPDAKTKNLIAKTERKIIENEKDWRLTNKNSSTNTSLNTWKSDKGSIDVTIVIYPTIESARKGLISMKGTSSKGAPRDLSGLGDIAFENVFADHPNSIFFVKGTTLVGIQSTLLSKKEEATVERFARHILNSLENK